MATFQFSTITPAQALALSSSDSLNIDVGTADAATVLYIPATGGNSDEISLTEGPRTVTFDTALATATKTFADGSMLYVGGPGDDAPAAFGATSDAMFGGLGNDTLSAGAGSNLLQGNQGNDLLTGGAGTDTIYGGADNDRIDVGASANGGFANFGQGNKGDDTLTGSPTDNDTLLGGQGDDMIGATHFSFSTTSGFSISGQSGGGADYLDGNLGNDTIVGGGAGGVLYGEAGADFLYDAGVRNTLDGGLGNDTIVSVQGGDSMTGGDGDDVISSGYNNANAVGATLDGGNGNDNLNSGASAAGDSLTGGAGDDTLDGGAGSDTMTGGAGSDLFEVSDGFGGTTASQLDTISDWDGAHDKLYFGTDTPATATAANFAEISATDYASALTAANSKMASGAAAYVAVQIGADVVVFADGGGHHVADAAVLLVGKSLTDISASNFTAVAG